MKKKYMLMGIAAVLIPVTMVGGTLAALNTKSEKAVANISIKSVGVTVIGDQPVALADGGEKNRLRSCRGNDRHAEGSTKRYPGWL